MALHLKQSICGIVDKISLYATKLLLLLFVSMLKENGALAVQGEIWKRIEIYSISS